MDGMKAALISDIHFGVRKSSDHFLDSQMRFFKKQFIPYLLENNIKDIFILGDLMDNRNYINVKILTEVYELFSVDMKSFNIRILLGNHDIYYKTSVQTHSLKFLESLPNVEVISEIKIDKNVYLRTGKKTLLVPWIIDDDHFIKQVSNKNIECDYCFGHFEMNGFNLTKYMPSSHGIDPNIILDNYKITFSGHYHQRSKKEKNNHIVQYLGSPYQLTRNDIDDDERGFAILDFNTGNYEFINNTESFKFKAIKYPNKFTVDDIKGNIVDVLIDYDENYKETMVQKYINIVEKYEPLFPPNIKIENKMSQGEIGEIEKQTVEDLLKEYIESLEIKNKDDIYKEIIELLKNCGRG